MKRSKKYLPVFLLFLFGWGLKSCGGVSSPPIGIPTPISNLINVSGPDFSGRVFVSGAPGAVLPTAQVQTANVSDGGAVFQAGAVFRWPQILIRSAWAQMVGVTDDASAGVDGSFQLIVTADVGDMVRVVQVVSGEKSPPVDLPVTGNSVPLGSPPKGIFVDSLSHKAYVTTPQESTGELLSLDLNASGPQPQFVLSLPGFTGITENAIDGIDQRGLAISTSDNTLAAFSLKEGRPPLFSPLNSPLSLDLFPSLNLAAIGVQSGTESFFLYRTDTNSFLCPFLIPHPLGEAEHRATPAIRVTMDSRKIIQVVAVSQFSDQSWVVSHIRFNGCPNFSPVDQVTLPPVIQPGDIALINSGKKALVTDNGTNLVYLIDFDQKTASPLEVGNAPLGVTVNPFTNRAYVVNQHDHSVTSLDLATLATTTRKNVGLSPTKIALDPIMNRAVVISSLDSSLILLDLNF